MRSASDKIEEWLDEPFWDFLAKSAGVGLSGTIIEIVKAQGWAEGVGDEVIQGIAGLLAIKYGDRLHDQMPNFGKGVLYNLVGRVVFEERIAPIFTEKVLGKTQTKQALTKAFTQKYGRDPTTQELTLMQRALAQQQRASKDLTAPSVNLEKKTPVQPQAVIDWHYANAVR